MIPLVACIVWLGVYPAPVLRRMETAATHFVTQVNARRDMLSSVAEARQ
jgi:NADH:ubiquinone oxidoreductase subunit 4 (subunit M)